MTWYWPGASALRVLPRRISVPGLALELQGDVLGDVARPRAVAQPGDEAAAASQRAGVILQPGEQVEEGRVNPGMVFDGNSSRTPRSTSRRMAGS